MNLTVILIGITVLVSILKYLWSKKRFFQLANELSGPPAYPIVGNALKFACKSDMLLERIVNILESYADVKPIRLWMGLELYVVVTEPSDIEIILNSQQSSVKGSNYKFFYPFIGNGLISGYGKTWKAHRKMVLPLLNRRTLESFVETFDRCSKELTDKTLKPLANGKTFDIFHYIEACTINVCCETIIGHNYDEMSNPNREFTRHANEMYKIVYDRMIKVWLHSDFIFRLTSSFNNQRQAKKVINEFTERCIESTRREMQKGQTGKSVLHRLLSANDLTNELSDEELRDEIYTIYLAAQDTLAVTSSFAITMLGIHKNVQDKARDEVNRVHSDNEISIESLTRLKILETIVKETLRLFPIAPLLVRRLSGDLRLESCTLPKDCNVVLACYGTHRSSKYWEKQNEFFPERFEDEQNSNRHPYAFIPFSGGSMGCIGRKFAMMAIKVMLVNILRKYTIKSNFTSVDEIKLKTDISIRSVNGYMVSLEPIL